MNEFKLFKIDFDHLRKYFERIEVLHTEYGRPDLRATQEYECLFYKSHRSFAGLISNICKDLYSYEKYWYQCGGDETRLQQEYSEFDLNRNLSSCNYKDKHHHHQNHHHHHQARRSRSRNREDTLKVDNRSNEDRDSSRTSSSRAKSRSRSRSKSNYESIKRQRSPKKYATKRRSITKSRSPSCSIISDSSLSSVSIVENQTSPKEKRETKTSRNKSPINLTSISLTLGAELNEKFSKPKKKKDSFSTSRDKISSSKSKRIVLHTDEQHAKAFSDEPIKDNSLKEISSKKCSIENESSISQCKTSDIISDSDIEIVALNVETSTMSILPVPPVQTPSPVPPPTPQYVPQPVPPPMVNDSKLILESKLDALLQKFKKIKSNTETSAIKSETDLKQ